MRAKRDPYEQGLRLSAANRHADAIMCFEEALKDDPGDVRVLFALGNTATALGMAKPAETFFRQVLALEPGRIEALVNLANLLRAQGQFDAAQALIAPALARSPKTAELWLTLGSILREMGDAKGAEAHYREALALRPDYPQALGNLADLLADKGEIVPAFALHNRALELDPQNAQAKLNRAILHLLRGNLKDGWRDYEARLQLGGKTAANGRGLPRWNGESLKDRRLLISAEQGLGDQIMFASMIPELAERATHDGGAIVLECEPRLVSLFARSFPGVRICASGSGGDADAFIEMGSLPSLIRNEVALFPRPHRYLTTDGVETRHWSDAFSSTGPRPFVGICWRSGKSGGARNLQYAPLSMWADFIRRLPGTIICAQYDATADEVGELEKLSARRVLVPAGLDQKNELDRTCAMLSAPDAVVSAPTAVSWLAAAAGTPTFKILYDTSWTSFGKSCEPFAPACELIMPAERGNWTDAFDRAVRRLTRLSASA
jgi:Flp pilus assembly protein TadD